MLKPLSKPPVHSSSKMYSRPAIMHSTEVSSNKHKSAEDPTSNYKRQPGLVTWPSILTLSTLEGISWADPSAVEPLPR